MFAWRCRTKGCDRPSSTRTFEDRELAARAAKNHKRQRRAAAPGTPRRRAHRVEVVEEA